MANAFDTSLIAATPEFLTMFGETVTYKPLAGGSREITAVVNREGVGSVNGLPHGQGPLVTICVANNAVTGISRAELDAGGDKVSLAWRTGGAARDCAIVEPPLSEDAGMLELELR